MYHACPDTIRPLGRLEAQVLDTSSVDGGWLAGFCLSKPRLKPLQPAFNGVGVDVGLCISDIFEINLVIYDPYPDYGNGYYLLSVVCWFLSVASVLSEMNWSV